MVSVDGVGWAAMQLLLQYIYLGEAIVPAHLLPAVVAAGEALGVTGLKNFRKLLSPQAQVGFTQCMNKINDCCVWLQY